MKDETIVEIVGMICATIILVAFFAFVCIG